MMHILKYRYLQDYTLFVSFDNGVQGIVDLKDLPEEGTVFAPLKDVNVFKNIKLAYGGVITWLDGTLDIAPEYIFYLMNRDNNIYKSLFKEWGYLEQIEHDVV